MREQGIKEKTGRRNSRKIQEDVRRNLFFHVIMLSLTAVMTISRTLHMCSASVLGTDITAITDSHRDDSGATQT